MKRRYMAGLIPALAASLLLLCGYSSLDEKVFDEADLLTDAEEQELQEEIVDLAEKLSLDVVIVTTDDARGMDTDSYAEDFYDRHGFGYEKENGSGILFLIDMDNRQYYIDAAAAAQEIYTDMERRTSSMNWKTIWSRATITAPAGISCAARRAMEPTMK